MCEYKEIRPRDFEPRQLSTPGKMEKSSYLSDLKRRVNAWNTLVSSPNKQTFQNETKGFSLTEEQLQMLWMLVCYAHFHLISPLAFFDFLMEVAVEEKATFTSFATAEKLRKWPKNPIPARFQDNFLLFLYLMIRDGRSALAHLDELNSL